MEFIERYEAFEKEVHEEDIACMWGIVWFELLGDQVRRYDY
jgi:hypothetical protein